VPQDSAVVAAERLYEISMSASVGGMKLPSKQMAFELAS
jgi:hypothetical protein